MIFFFLLLIPLQNHGLLPTCEERRCRLLFALVCLVDMIGIGPMLLTANLGWLNQLITRVLSLFWSPSSALVEWVGQRDRTKVELAWWYRPLFLSSCTYENLKQSSLNPPYEKKGQASVCFHRHCDFFSCISFALQFRNLWAGTCFHSNKEHGREACPGQVCTWGFAKTG